MLDVCINCYKVRIDDVHLGDLPEVLSTPESDALGVEGGQVGAQR